MMNPWPEPHTPAYLTPTPMPMPDFGQFDPMGEYMPQEDFHSVISISFGELVRTGFVVWGEKAWRWDAYDEKQYWRVCEKIENHYWNRDIAIVPPGDWRREFMRTMNEIMPKFKLAYRALNDGITLMQVADDYGKSRTVGSDFPATQLQPTTQDYASNAADNEYENLHEGDYLERVDKLQSYVDIDTQIVYTIEPLFSCLLTVSMNGGYGL